MPSYGKQKPGLELKKKKKAELFYIEVFTLIFLFPQMYVFLAELVSCVMCMVLSFKGGRQRENLTTRGVCEFSYEKAINIQNYVRHANYPITSRSF